MDRPVTGRWSRLTARLRRGTLRGALAALTALVLTVPFVVAWRVYVNQQNVTRQVSVPAARVDAATAARWRAVGAGLPERAAPVILTYHDLKPHSRSRYIVDPAVFERQLSALQAAGYRTLTTEEFVDYLLGGPVPPRSVMLTFDDGTHGLWTYGDRVLARHRMHAASFLITGRVGRHRPYYLSWQEIARMARSGRWDFEDHTHDLHSRTRIGPHGELGSLLAHRRYLGSTGRLESTDHYERRVRADFASSLAAFEEHGLPRPSLFAYPFSESADPQQTSYVRDLIERTFAAALTDKTFSPEPAARRSAVHQEYQRLEVFADTTADALLAQVAARTPVPPSGDPLRFPERWTGISWKPLGSTGALTGKGVGAGAGSYVYGAYAPYGAADWDHYSVTAGLTALPARGGSATVFARVGGDATVGVRVSHGTAQVVSGRAHNRVLAEHALTPGPAHEVRLTVDGARTEAVVDGRHRFSVPNSSGVRGTGGIALALSRGDSGGSWPAFNRLETAPLPGPPPAARPFDAPAGWTDGDGHQARAVIGAGGVQPIGPRGWNLAAYRPGGTTHWSGYTLHTRLTGLSQEGLHSSVVVRRGAPDQLTVRLSRGWITLLSGPGDHPRTVLSRKLPEATERDVRVTVGARSSDVTVGDGLVHASVPAAGGTGGFALGVYRQSPSQPWPGFEGCTVGGGRSA
ncbi:polysaccharide deacetylase family protein [Streptomyces griseorubiginosus]|uniref:polysaccharide deacetylase family protein n=1 Tax=Streptomyces griseorubiginosus TaxID=67304 RepID=UPI0036E2C18F